MTLMNPENHLALLAGLFIIVALGFASENTALGRRVSGASVVLFTAIVASNLNILPTSATVYDAVWSLLVPVAIALYLIKADILSIVTESGRTLIAFAFGLIGSMAGALIGAALLNLGPYEAQLAGVFAATYTGGSLNFAAVADAIGFREASLLSAAVAIDNVLGLLYFLLLGVVGSSVLFKRLFPWRSEELGDIRGAVQGGKSEISAGGLSIALGIATSVCALGYYLAGIAGIEDYGILLITVLMVAIATLARRQLENIHGSEVIATLFMYLFFTVLGASADVGEMLKAAPTIFLFVLLIFTVHIVFILVSAKLFKLNIGELVIASLACIGGPPIAIAFAILFGWRKLAAPAIATGILGYVVGNFIGIGIFQLL